MSGPCPLLRAAVVNCVLAVWLCERYRGYGHMVDVCGVKTEWDGRRMSGNLRRRDLGWGSVLFVTATLKYCFIHFLEVCSWSLSYEWVLCDFGWITVEQYVERDPEKKSFRTILIFLYSFSNHSVYLSGFRGWINVCTSHELFFETAVFLRNQNFYLLYYLYWFFFGILCSARIFFIIFNPSSFWHSI